MEFSRHLLVDGSNILHAWPELSGLLKRDRDTARTRLIQRLAAIHDVENVRVTVVFDGRGKRVVVEHPSGQATFSVVHTSSSLTADDVIEQTVTQASEPARCVVATDDRAERAMLAAAGAELLRPQDLRGWVERVEARQASALAKRQAANAKDWKAP